MGKPKVKIKHLGTETSQQHTHQNLEQKQHKLEQKEHNLQQSKIKIREVSWRYDSKNLSIVTPVKIQKRDIDAVIDSGAQVSVLNEQIYKSMKNPPNLTESVHLTGVGENDSISAKLAKNVSFRVGSQYYKLNMYIAPISDSMILGLDFLTQHNFVIDLNNNEMRNKDNTIPINIVKENSNEYQVRRVLMKSKTVIPPHTVVRTKIKMSGTADENVIFAISPNHTNPKVLIPNTVVTGDKEGWINIMNPTDYYQHINKDKLIGIATEIDDVLEDNETTNEEKIPSRTSKSIAETRITDDDTKSRETPNTDAEPKVRRILTSEDNLQRLPDHLKDLFIRSSLNLNNEEQTEFADTLIEFSDVFSKNDLDLGCFDQIKLTINTGDAKPIRENMRRTPFNFEQEEEEHLKSMLKANVISPSNSEWASCPVLVRKKDGKVRWCIDYRKLNALTVKDSFPLPKIEECLDTLAGNTWFSTLDMNSGYWQIEIDEKDRHKTAFITKYGLFQHNRMAYGLTNAPSCFQRVVQLMLQGMTWKQILAFLDDIIVLGKLFKGHLANIRRVLERFRKHNLKLKPKKCIFFQKQVVFLGKLVNEQGVSVNPENIEKVKNWPTPNNVKEVEQFLGFINYHREHIKDYAQIAQPLYALTGPKVQFTWNEEHQYAFDTLIKMMTNLPTLSYPNPELEFILDTDASDKAIGAELLQFDPVTRIENVIAYGSYVLTPAQQKYCTTRKELLAIVRFTRQYRHYLLGRRFTIRTDHNSLTWLLRFKNIQGMLARWLEELSQFDMIIIHRPGKFHQNADSLSRIPTPDRSCSNYNSEINLQDLPCGGCSYCRKLDQQWAKFESDVNDVIPLAIKRIHNPSWCFTYSNEKIRNMQLEDPVIGTLLHWLENNIEPEQKDLMLRKPALKRFWRNRSQLNIQRGVLYYKWEETDKSRNLLLVPETLKEEVLRHCHDLPSSGHFGIRKTYKKIKQSFMWYKRYLDTKLYVQTCPHCNKNKKPNKKPKFNLGQYHASSPLEKIHIDLLGPFPTSNSGNNYILSIVDQFTKWIEIFPVKSQTSEETAKTIVDGLISRFGCPIEIVTDQGKCFESNLFQALCSILNITKTRTTPYHPAANGQVERYNRVILAMMRCTLKDDVKDWDLNLQQLAGAIRATENRHTGFTPNFLMLGREVITPVEIVAGILSKSEPYNTYPDYVKHLIKIQETAHSKARLNLKQSQQIQKRNYDLKTKETMFSKGDVVYRLNLASKIGESNKLKEVYSGPYVVTQVITPRVIQIRNRKRSFNIHHDNLKLCKDRDLPVWVQRLKNKILENQELDQPPKEISLESLFEESDIETDQNNDYSANDTDRSITNDDNDDRYDYVDPSLAKLFNEPQEDDKALANIQPDRDEQTKTIDTKNETLQTPVTRTGRKINRPAYLSDFY